MRTFLLACACLLTTPGATASAAADSLRSDTASAVHTADTTVARHDSLAPRGERRLTAGLALGTPGGLNAILGLRIGRFNPRISGMIIGKITGVEFDLAFDAVRAGDFRVEVYTGVGYSELTTSQTVGGGAFPIDIEKKSVWRYVALGVGIRWGGFLLAGGPSYGSGSYRNPQFVAQLGWIWERRAAGQ